MNQKKSDNLVKDHLEEIKVVSPDEYVDYVMLGGEKWDTYRPSDNTAIYVKYELTGKIGYAFCATIVCSNLSISFESFYHVFSYGNTSREKWECGQQIKDQLIGNAIKTIQPY